MMRALRLCLGVLLAAAPTVTSAPLEANLEVRGEATFEGHGFAIGQWTGALHQDPEPGIGLAVDGTARLLTYTYAFVERDPGNPSGFGRDMELVDSREENLPIVNGTLETSDIGPHASLRLIPQTAEDLPCRGQFRLTGWQQFPDPFSAAIDAQPANVRGAFYPGSGAPVKGCQLDEGHFIGRVVITDAAILGPGGRIDTIWSHPDHVQGIGSAGLLETKVLVIDGAIATAARDLTGWTTYVNSLKGDIEGDLVLQNAQGTGQLNGTTLPPGIHMFQATGSLSFSADYARPVAVWQITGDANLVAVNAGTVWNQDAVNTAVASLALISVLVLLIKWLRITGVVLPGLNVANPFGNQQRLRILTLVASNPGIDQASLAREATVSRGTLRHHLRILLRSDLITKRSISSRSTYTLNDDSYEFPVVTESGSAGEAFALLRHPTRQALLEALERGGSADYEALHSELCRRGLALPRDAASYHLGLLRRAGLVDRSMQGKRALWSARVNTLALRARQSERFLKAGRLTGVLDAVSIEPMPAVAVWRKLRAKDPSATIRDVTAKLDLLTATGYIRQHSSGYSRLAN